MNSTGGSSESSRIFIDISDEDADNGECELFAKCRKEMEALRAKFRALREENSTLKSKLRETKQVLEATQSELGNAVVANKMRTDYSTTTDIVVPALPAASSKRPRSPSINSLEPVLMPPADKGKIMYVPSPKKKKLEEGVNISSSQMRSEPNTNGVAVKQSGGNYLSANSVSSTQPVVNSGLTVASSSPRNSLLESLEKYVESAPTLLIHPSPPEARVRRKPFVEHYGGSYQQFLQYIPKDLNPSGRVERNLVFPQPEPNPSLPVAPGKPGLIFASRHEVANNDRWSLFVKPNPDVALWTYLGDYKGEVCGKLTGDQFQALSEKQQQSWISLLKDQKTGVYSQMRARIAVRTQELLPLDDKEKEAKLKEDIRHALYQGHERIDIIRMTCVYYDHVFANDIRSNFTASGKLRPGLGPSAGGGKSKSSRSSDGKAPSKPVREEPHSPKRSIPKRRAARAAYIDLDCVDDDPSDASYVPEIII